MKYINIIILLGIVFFLGSCSSGEQDLSFPTITEDKVENNSENAAEESIPEKQDFSEFDEIIQELEGIEKFYVRDDIFRLYSVLESKGDEREEDLREKIDLTDLINVAGQIPIVSADIDQSNGYVIFDNTADCLYEMTYWKMSNGNCLIAETCIYKLQAPGGISFELFDPVKNEYTRVEIEEVIPELDTLEAMADAMNPILGADGGCVFRLPRKGKNISFCADDNCVDLIWNDGTFTLDK